ncbi:class I SAM-dependent methyltransferase [Streptomyces lateritius]|uniref:class I SAM-dependent methyltransferase n=1 Tax=Streptomyces lateritius TaxID=67313 RepID=UPI0016754748|nr:class I SAM-dependent methyltransferase [Streptomyces lateritius]GGU15139.1 methyltransferase type 11 [Streptomyces lateritius]
MTSQNLDLAGLRRVYGRPGSRIFYTLVAKNARHWGWTEPGQSRWRMWRAQRQLEDVLGKKLDLPAGAHVLDAGCGSGVVARAMASRFGLKVTGIDVLDFNIRQARRINARAALETRNRFEWGDFHRLDFPDESFDGAYSMETLVHAHDVQQVLAEMFRLLRPGGRLVLIGPTTAPLEDMSPQSRAVMEPYFQDMACHGLQHYSTGDLERILEKVGFHVDEVLDVTENHLPTTTALHDLFRVPYALVGAVSDTKKWLNLRSVVEMAHAREFSHWIHTATKPR